MALTRYLIIAAICAAHVALAVPHRRGATIDLSPRPGAVIDMQSLTRLPEAQGLQGLTYRGPAASGEIIGAARFGLRDRETLQFQMPQACAAVTICAYVRAVDNAITNNASVRIMQPFVCADFDESRTNLTDSAAGTNYFDGYSANDYMLSDNELTNMPALSISTNWVHLVAAYSPGETPAWTGWRNGEPLLTQARWPSVTATSLSAGAMVVVNWPTLDLGQGPYLELQSFSVWPRALTRDEVLRDFFRCKMMQTKP